MERTGRKRSSGGVAAVAVVTALWLGVTPEVSAAQSMGATADPVGEALTLEEALTLARANNPGYLSQANDLVSARWGLRAARASLLPSASASMGLGYTAAGERRFGDIGLGSQPAMYSSSYSLGLSYSVSGAELLAPRRARSQELATEARLEGAESQLEAGVTQGYLAVLQADAALRQARQELERTAAHVRLAEARLEVGTGTTLDLRRAEVQQGQAEVQVIQAENTAVSERLALGQLLGVPLDEDVSLSTEFDLFEPTWEVERVIAMAQANNPTLEAARAQLAASGTSARVARSQYLPQLSASLSLRGNLAQAANITPLVEGDLSQLARSRESCLEENEIRQAAGLAPQACPDPTDPAVRQRLEDQYRAQHSGFPFAWEPQPLSASLSISLPIFTGLTRQQQVEEANVAVDDARHTVRSEELRVRAEAETLLRNVTAAYRTAQLQARVRDTAAEELRLAEEQYRSGLATSVEVTDAQAALSEAERAEIGALYDYHQSLAALEALLGVPLR